MFDLTLKRIIIKKNKIPRRKPGLNLIIEKRIKDITGLNKEEFYILIEQLNKLIVDKFNCQKYSIEDQLIIFAFYTRENLTMRAIEGLLGVNNTTVSRIVRRLSLLVGLISIKPTIKEQEPQFVLIDGTLTACSDKRISELSRNKKYSANIQILADKNTKLVLKSSITKGNVHDSKSYKEGIKQYLKDNNIKSEQVIGDLGYYGVDNIRTPYKKPNNTPEKKCAKGKKCDGYRAPIYRDITEGQKNWNTLFRKERSIIERIIANLKSYKILRHSRLRYTPLESIIDSISTMYNLRKIMKYGIGYIVNNSITESIENVVKREVVP